MTIRSGQNSSRAIPLPLPAIRLLPLPLLAIGLLVLPLLVQPALAQTGVPGLPPGEAVLQGVVAGPSGPAAGIQIALYALTQQGHPGLGDAVSDENGRFRFEKISNDPSIAYLLGARYGGIPFSQRVAFEAGQTTVDVRIDVSDPVADATPVEVRSTRMRFDWAGSQLAVRVTQALDNPTAEIRYIGEGKRKAAAPLRVATLPKGATGFTRLPASGGKDLELDGAEVVYWGPFFPGEQELSYQYLLPASAGELALDAGFPSGSGSLAIAFPPTGPSIEAGGLAVGPPIEIDGVSYQSLDGGPVPAGAKVALALSLPEMRQEAGALALPRSELFLELDDASLIVNQDLVLEVPPGPPLVAAPGETLLTLELPVGSQLLGLSREAAAIGLSAGAATLSIAGPLPAGTSRVGFRYGVPVRENGVKLDLRFPILVDTLRVNIADTGDLVVSSNRMHRLRPARGQTRTYLQREAFHVEPGERIELQIARPIPTPLPRSAAIGLVVAAGALACFYLIRPLQSDREADPQEEALDRISHERSLVYASIHDLDHDYETGKIAEADYQTMRAELRETAIDLLRRERQPPAEVQEIRSSEQLGVPGIRSSEQLGVPGIRSSEPLGVPGSVQGFHSRDQAGAEAAGPVPTGSFCPSCGGRVDRSWRFCSHCGGGLTPQQSAGRGSTG